MNTARHNCSFQNAAIKHRMGRRCNGWNYRQRAIYYVTLVLANRHQWLFGDLVELDGEWSMQPSALGAAVVECWRGLAREWPGIEIIGEQLMPEHFHGVIFVKKPLSKPLGAIIGSFKAKTTNLYRDASVASLNYCPGSAPRLPQLPTIPTSDSSGPGSAPRRSRRGLSAPLPSLWAPGYVDYIMWRKGQLPRTLNYMRDNPRRLAEKRAHPELFKVLRSLAVNLGSDPTWSGPKIGRFAAIGNHNLLSRPWLFQVQCSRSLFEYRRERLSSGAWRVIRDEAGAPIVAKTTAEFEAKVQAALAAAKDGAVIVSPSISHGEREIARRVHIAGGAVIALKNKGFSDLYKPGGRLFDECADGRLLLLAPAAWPYLPGEKPITRQDALALNRLAQLIARDGAAKIDYKGAVPANVDALAAAAVTL